MRLRGRFFLAAILLSAGQLAARAETLGDGWGFRRALAFKQTLSDLPGENVAWVEFYANGKQQGDWSDLRITAADPPLMPQKIMQMPKGDFFVRVAFATKGDALYSPGGGNAKAPKPANELDIHRGILLDVTSGMNTPA